MQRIYLLENILMLGKIEGKRRRGWPMMRLLDIINNSTDMILCKLEETVKVGTLAHCSPWSLKQLDMMCD